MYQSTNHNTLNKRKPSLVVLAVVVVVSLLVAIPAYVTGKSVVGERKFVQEYRTPNDKEARMYCNLNYIDHSTEDNEVVVVGDSTGMSGVDTLLLQRLSGRSAINLSCPGCYGLESMTLMVERYLKLRAKPRLLVLCINPFTLTWNQFVERERDRFIWCYGPQTELSTPRNGYPLSLFYTREGICFANGRLSERLGKPPLQQEGRFWAPGKNYLVFERDWQERRGFFSYEREFSFRHRAIQGDLGPLFVNQESVELVRELARLTARHSIPLLIWPMPSVDAALSLPSREYYDRIPSLLGDLESEFRHVRIGTYELLYYPSDLMWDEVHCNRSGSQRFTPVLAKSIQGLLTNN